MQDKEVINILQKHLNFTTKSIVALKIFVDALINASTKILSAAIDLSEKLS